MKYLQELEDFETHRFLEEYMKDILDENKKHIDVFDREASYHFCYNYFRNFYEDDNVKEISSSNNIEVSCLQLGFYLASWGMYRGSGKIYYRSIKIYEGIIKKIPEVKSLWEIDVDNYNEDNIKSILEFKNELQKSLSVHEITATDTLTTKIMMGVFGCVPAFDSYFIKGLKVKALNKHSLIEIKNFYDKNQNIIDSFYGNENLKTLDIATKGTKFNYKKAKIVDMIGFILGDYIDKDAKAIKKNKQLKSSP